jgi:hypothetical protein
MTDEAQAAQVLTREDPKREGIAVAIGVAGWLVPGLGHALQKMWGRAITCFLTIAALVAIGDVVKERIGEVEREAADMRAYIATA